MTPAEAALRDAWLSERFWPNVDCRGPNECWPWVGYHKPGGYGDFRLPRGTSTTASRVALSIHLGRDLNRGEYACHRCDNPPCCNPAHLFVGTQSDNILDSVAKGRANRALGSASGSAKLTEKQVAEIRSHTYYYGLNSDLGRFYGVSRHTIRQIRAGKLWRHVL